MINRETTKLNEGLRLTVYDDKTGRTIGPGSVVIGYPSIGYGTNLTVPISEEAADFLYNERYDEAVTDIFKIFPRGEVEMDSAQLLTLVDMRYQMGSGGFRLFKAMIAAVKAGDWPKAADECMNSDYGRDPLTTARAQANADALRNG